MATTTVPKDAPADGKPAAKKPKKSKKKLIIIIVAVLALGGGVYKFKFAPKPKPGPPVAGEVVKMDPTTLNLADGHYLKVAVDISLVAGKATATDFQISHAEQLVIDEFSNRQMSSLQSNSERQQLTKDLEKKIKKAYDGEVFTIYLTQFVAQ
jgi:flagellar FliL protein